MQIDSFFPIISSQAYVPEYERQKSSLVLSYNNKKKKTMRIDDELHVASYS